jgi:uncharacterized protein (DUF342 family)
MSNIFINSDIGLNDTCNANAYTNYTVEYVQYLLNRVAQLEERVNLLENKLTQLTMVRKQKIEEIFLDE